MSLIGDLRSAVGPQQLRTTGLEPFCVDWTRGFTGRAVAVVAPRDADEVVAVIRSCRDAGVPLVTQGGNTGLVGGGVPGPEPAVVLRTERLDQSPEAAPDGRSLLAGAGVTLQAVRAEARRAGRYYPVDLAARDQATIGGTVATNAGGIRVCAYGMTRQQLLGLEFVTGDGRVVTDLAALPKDNTGYDLNQLIAGSEGTLAIITKVVVRLRPQPTASTVLALPVADLATASAAVAAVEATGFQLLGAEVMDAQGWRLAAAGLGSVAPFDAAAGAALLIEVADGSSGDGVPEPLRDATDLVVALDVRERRRLWEIREAQTEAWSRLGLVHKFDVSVPFSNLDRFVARARAAALAVPGVVRFGYFGHIADGNLHLEVVGDAADPAGLTDAVLAVVAEEQGSVSAEHGIGRAKARHLQLRRSAAEISIMRRLKTDLDPDGILNPGVLLAGEPRPEPQPEPGAAPRS